MIHLTFPFYDFLPVEICRNLSDKVEYFNCFLHAKPLSYSQTTFVFTLESKICFQVKPVDARGPAKTAKASNGLGLNLVKTSGKS